METYSYPVAKAGVEGVLAREEAFNITETGDLEFLWATLNDFTVEGSHEPVGGHDDRTVWELVLALLDFLQVLSRVVCLQCP